MINLVSRCAFAITLLAASAVASVVLASPARAAVPGLTLATQTSATNSNDKNVVATCPPGTRLVGTGGQITGVPPLGQVIMDDLVPISPNQVSVTGNEDDLFAANWWLRAYAVCANPLPGQAQVAALSAASSANKSITAACPAGTRVVGAGADISGANGEAVIEAITPDAALTRVTVRASEEDPFPVNWQVRATAICANPLPGLIRISATSPSDWVSAKSTTAACPQGTRLIGTGGEVRNARGQAVMETMAPNPALTAATVGGREADSYDHNWSVTAYAICATP